MLLGERADLRVVVEVARDGERWRAPLEGPPLAPNLGRWAVAAKDKIALVIGGPKGTRLVGLDRATGERRYEVELATRAPTDEGVERPGGVWSHAGDVLATAPGATGTIVSLHDAASGHPRWRVELPTGTEAHPPQAFLGERSIAVSVGVKTWLLERNAGKIVSEFVTRGSPCHIGDRVVAMTGEGLRSWSLDSDATSALAAPELDELGAVMRCGAIEGHADDWLALWGPTPSYTLGRVSLIDGRLRWKVSFSGATLPTHDAAGRFRPDEGLGAVDRFVMIPLSGLDAGGDPRTDTWRALEIVDVELGRVVESRRWPSVQAERWLVLAGEGGPPRVFAYELHSHRLERFESATGTRAVVASPFEGAAPRSANVTSAGLWTFRTDAPIEAGAWRLVP